MTKEIADFLRREENRPIIMEYGLDLLLDLFLKEDDQKLLTQVVRSIANLSFDAPANIDKMFEKIGLVQSIMKCIKQETSVELKRNTIACLANFAHESDAVRTELNKEGGLELLFAEIQNKEDPEFPLFLHALRAIENICNCEECAIHFSKLGGIEVLSSLIEKETDEDEICQIVRTLTAFLPFESLGDLSKHVDPLSRFVVDTCDTNLLNQVLETFQIFGSLSDANLKHLFDNGVMKKIIQLIPEEELNVMAILGKMAEKDNLQNPLVVAGILPFLYNMTLTSTAVEKRREATKVLANLSLDDNNMAIMIDETLPIILKCATDVDAQVLRYSCIVIGNMARTDQNCGKIIDNDGHKALIKLLAHSEKEVKGNAAFALTNLIKLKARKQDLLDCGVLEELHKLLEVKSDLLEFYVCDGISNLCTKNETVSNLMYKLGIDKIIEILLENDKPKCQFAAIKVLIALAESSTDLHNAVKKDLSQNSIEVIKTLSTTEKIDTRINDLALKALLMFQ